MPNPTEDDDENMLNVAVLGSNTADRLFPFEEALGQSVRVGNYFYKVVGVLRERMPTGPAAGSSRGTVSRPASRRAMENASP